MELIGLYQQLEESELDRERLTVTSPSDGLISSTVGLHAGELLGSGATIATIIPSNHNQTLECWVPAKDRMWVREGQTVRIQREEASSDPTTIDGIVTSISPDAQIKGSLAAYRVLVAPVEKSPPLMFGMTLRVRFITHQEKLLLVLFHRLRTQMSA
jgi:multidrug resistance efflux pump